MHFLCCVQIKTRNIEIGIYFKAIFLAIVTMEYCYAEPSQFVSPLFLIAPLSITTRLRNCGIDGVVPYTVLGHHLISMYSGDRYTVTTPPPTLQDYIMSTVLPYMEISYQSPNGWCWSNSMRNRFTDKT